MVSHWPEFELIEPDEAVYADYAGRFGAYNAKEGGLTYEMFSLVLKDEGRITAGGRGSVYLGAVEIRGLWVDETLRGTGVGSRLLRAIEDEARRRGATEAMLYTYSWQAEGFYERHGYSVYARFEYPAGPYRLDMQKQL